MCSDKDHMGKHLTRTSAMDAVAQHLVVTDLSNRSAQASPLAMPWLAVSIGSTVRNVYPPNEPAAASLQGFDLLTHQLPQPSNFSAVLRALVATRQYGSICELYQAASCGSRAATQCNVAV
jgi:hypothetical protein